MKICVFMLGLLFWMGLLSTCVSAVGQAGRDLAFLNVGLGARASGMGTAYTALATDSHAAYWNPAGMMVSDPRTPYSRWPPIDRKISLKR